MFDSSTGSDSDQSSKSDKKLKINYFGKFPDTISIYLIVILKLIFIKKKTKYLMKSMKYIKILMWKNLRSRFVLFVTKVVLMKYLYFVFLI
jgi:hypothetical protein